jgi:hypothetical protein
MHPDYYFYAGNLGTDLDKFSFKALRTVGKATSLSYIKGKDFSAERDINWEEVKKAGAQHAKVVTAIVSVEFDVALCGMFESFRQAENSKIYKVNPDFLKAMQRMDVELREELLPKPGFMAYFSFEPGVMYDHDGDNLVGAYVSFIKSPWAEDRLLLKVGYTTKSDTTGPISGTFGNAGWVCLEVKAGDKFETSLDNLHGNENAHLGNPRSDVQDNIFRTFLNLSMYVHSLNPDVSDLKPIRELSSREKKEANKTNVGLRSSVYTVSLLNWSFGKDRQYSVDSTTVSTHLRWQPCGPGLSQTKLIIIEEHERHYKYVANKAPKP